MSHLDILISLDNLYTLSLKFDELIELSKTFILKLLEKQNILTLLATKR